MPDRRKPVDDAWDGYAKAVIPDDASEVQRNEMRKSFYAGAWMLFKLLMDEANDGEDESTESNVRMMDDVAVNLKAFSAEVRGQRSTHG